ncbi:hypothetical protein [uncultured Prevotella sp.]|uniref:hypothetical protein n=1 Tax=uncultured Prevotella sp. TaxID=159272 RepID=UPI0027E34CBC|nr:hypothetical protein [uncultured Prevotella sp.]
MAKHSNKDRMAVWVPCKGYVKRWLLANYNSPDDNWAELVNLSPNRELAEDFRRRLIRGEARRDNSVRGRYTTQVAIEISMDTFNRYGWMLSPTETLHFNSRLERDVKQVLHTYSAMLSVTGMSIAERIKRFRKATGITENDWDTDSIRKELQRNAKIDAKDDFKKICKKMEQKCWAVLSKSGHITEQGKELYEKDQF